MRVLWIAFLIVVVDQATKVWVKTNMYLGESIPVIGDVFKWTFTENPGMAFGLELGSKVFLTVFSVLATFLILGYLWHVRKGPVGYRVALALVLGGAFGNVIDRVFYGVWWGYDALLYGKVVDFIHIDIGTLRVPEFVPGIGGSGFQMFPIGNIADQAIIAGVVLIVITQGAFQEWVARTHSAGLMAAPRADGAAPVVVDPVAAPETFTDVQPPATDGTEGTA